MACLKDKVAIVTGGGSGIGLAVARALATEGMYVTICGRNRNRLEKASGGLAALPGHVTAIPADVSNREDVRGLIRETQTRHRRVDLLVNNAGIGQSGTLEKFSPEDWDRVLAINLKGAFLCSQAVLPIMRRQKSGYVVNISSVAGKIGMGGMGAYSASKFGMVGLTHTLVEEGEACNIRATAICPGYVATPMVKGAPVPFRKMIQPEDIARTVLYLLHLSENAVIKEIIMERKGAD